MTAQERNEYLKIMSWQVKERQLEFDLSRIRQDSKYNSYCQLLEKCGHTCSSGSSYSYTKERLNMFLSTKKTKDGKIKITKVKGESVQNPFSWELKTPVMSTQYMIEMMIIYVLDNDLNNLWDRYEWCRFLGLIPNDRKEYSFFLSQYPDIYLNEAYSATKQIGIRRIREAFSQLQERGVIKQNIRMVCRDSVNTPFRELTCKEQKAYKKAAQSIYRTREDVKIDDVILYSEAYSKFLSELKTYPIFKDLYFKFVIEPEYLYPDEHSYLRDYEFYLYQKRVQMELKDKVFKLLSGRKDKMIKQMACYYKSKIRNLDKQNFPNDLIKDLEKATERYWKKKFSKFRTEVRDVTNVIFRESKICRVAKKSFSEPNAPQTRIDT